MDLNTLNIVSAAKGLREKKFSSVELTQSCLKQIDEKNKVVTLLDYDHHDKIYKKYKINFTRVNIAPETEEGYFFSVDFYILKIPMN